MGYNTGMEEDILATTIGKNIMRLRRMANMTQLELAEKINYSDKSVSKWEQGNGIPDVRILVQLADLFNVSVDDLVRDAPETAVMPKKTRLRRRIITMILSVGLCWLVAVVCFVLIGIGAPRIADKWLAFVYAVPASAIVTLVFACIWHYRWTRIVSITVLMPVAYVYLIGVPLQVLAVIFFSPWKKVHFSMHRDKSIK